MISSDIILKRLSLVKYLYKQGIQQSMQGEAVAGFSLLSLHDSVEIFLFLVAENNNVKEFRKLNFLDFWQKIPSLTMQGSMSVVNNIRVAIKHRGQMPSKSDINDCITRVSDFLKENIKKQFNLSFEDISLCGLIQYADVREQLIKAEKELKERNYFESLVKSKIAFILLLNEFENSKKVWFDNIFDIGDKIRDEYKSLVGNSRESKWFSNITETTNEIRDAVKIIGLGIDYKKYSLFKKITPTIYNYQSEFRLLGEKEFYDERIFINETSCVFCIDFVIETAIIFQDDDFDVKKYLKV